MARQIVIDIIGDSKKFQTATKEATGAAKGFGSTMSTGLGVAAGLGAFSVVKDAAEFVVGKLGEADAAFKDSQVVQGQLRQSLQNNVPGWNGNTSAIDAYASAQAKLGFTSEDVKVSIATLVGITHNQTDALKDEALAQDLARAKGISLADATAIVTKAAEGNGKALKSLGIDISDIAARTAVHTKADDDAIATAKARLASIKDHKSEAYADAQAQLAQAEAFKKTDLAAIKAGQAGSYLADIQANVKGGADAYAQTSSGKLASAQAREHEAWIKIGSIVDRVAQVVMPLMAQAIGFVADQIDPLEKQLDPLIKTFQEDLPKATAALTSIWKNDLQPIVALLTDNGKDMEPVLIAVAAVIMAAVVPALVSMMIAAAPVTLAIIGIAAVVYLLVKAWEHFPWLRAIVESFIGTTVKSFQFWVNVVKGIPGFVHAMVTDVGGFFNGLGTAVHNVIQGTEDDWNRLTGFVASLPDRIKTAASGMWDSLWQEFRGTVNMLLEHWNKLQFKIGGGSFMGQNIPSFSLGVPEIPYFDQGGTVPGPPGSRQFVAALGGEKFGGAQSIGKGGDIHIHIAGSVWDIDSLTRAIAHELDMRGATA